MRVKRLQIHPMLLMKLCSGTFKVIADPIPEDARFCGATMDDQLGCVTLFIASKSFPEIPDGESLPVMNPPMIQRIEENDAG